MANQKKGVPDSGLILQATLSPRGPSSQVLSLLDAGKIVIYLSPQTREEIEDILIRPAIRQKYPHLTDERAEAMLERLDEKAELVTVLRRYIE